MAPGTTLAWLVVSNNYDPPHLALFVSSQQWLQVLIRRDVGKDQGPPGTLTFPSHLIQEFSGGRTR